MADAEKKKRVRKPVTVDSLKEALEQWQKAIGSHTLALADLRDKIDKVTDAKAKAKLEERLAAEEQKLRRSQELAQRAQTRLTALKQRTENQDQKKRTHRLIVMGALVEKAGLGDWPRERLLGGLLDMASQAKLFERWERRGKQELAKAEKGVRGASEGLCGSQKVKDEAEAAADRLSTNLDKIQANLTQSGKA